MIPLPDTISAFICGALLMQALIRSIFGGRWVLLAALGVLNGVFAWVL